MSLCYSLVPSLLSLLHLLPHHTRAFVLEGSKTSYAQFPPWDDRGRSSLSVEFRTDLPSGLLLYSDSDQATSCHFLHLTLVRGSVRLRFNSGQGAQVLRVTSSSSSSSSTGFSDGQWHTVKILRAGPNTSLTVDNINEDSVSCQEQELDQTRTDEGNSDNSQGSLKTSDSLQALPPPTTTSTLVVFPPGTLTSSR